MKYFLKEGSFCNTINRWHQKNCPQLVITSVSSTTSARKEEKGYCLFFKVYRFSGSCLLTIDNERGKIFKGGRESYYCQ